MKKRSNIFSLLLFGIIYPFGGLIYSIRNFRLPASKYLFVIFCAFFGSVLIFQRGGSDSNLDAGHYAYLFEQAYFWDNIGPVEFYNKLSSHDRLDFFNPFVTYIFSRISGNPHFYFTVIGLIFGFFYANNVWDVIKYSKRSFNIYTALLLVAFVLICSFDTIGTVRMHTAFQVFFYGIFSYLISGNKKRLIWVPLSILFHFSMFSMVGAVLLYFIVNKFDARILFIYFIVAHLVNELDLGIIHRLFSFMPQDVGDRLSAYSSEDNLLKLQESGKFYLSNANLWARIDSMIIRSYILVQTIVLFIAGNFKLIKLPDLTRLLKFSLVLYGTALILANLPSGYRYMTLAGMFFMSYYVLLYNRYGILMKQNLVITMKLFSPLMIVFVIKSLRNILDATSIFVFIGNFITSMFFHIDIPIVDLFKRLL
ncbi:MAG: hypothetical protein RBQ97_12245 [Acholeplasma sp.]|nr:hypothetical protein [Acholeplasma sp.]OJV37862.1 MAG: hypothetical protein BGO33_07940 [Bacteroidia bacterium 43-41]